MCLFQSADQLRTSSARTVCVCRRLPNAMALTTVAMEVTRLNSAVSRSSFFLLIPLHRQNFSSFLLSGNKRDRLETLTHCAEWSQFAVEYFFATWPTLVGARSSNISRSKLFIVLSMQAHYPVTPKLIRWPSWGRWCVFRAGIPPLQRRQSFCPIELETLESSCTLKIFMRWLQRQELIRRWDTRTWHDVSSYLFTYLPLNYDTPVVPEYFSK